MGRCVHPREALDEELVRLIVRVMRNKEILNSGQKKLFMEILREIAKRANIGEKL